MAAGVLAGLVFCLPDLLIMRHRAFYERHFPKAVAQWPLGGRFTAISPLDDADANSYAGRMNEAARHAWPMDPNIKENTSKRLALTDPLSFIFLGALKRLAGDISRAWLWARGLCGFLWLTTFYLLLHGISGRRRASLAGAAALTLFYELFADILWPLAEIPEKGLRILPALRYVVVHAFWLLGNYQANLGASRLVSPALNYPPFFLACFAAWKASRGSWSWALAGGVLGGAIVYIHPDLWPVYMAAMGLFCAFWSAQGRALNLPLWVSWALSLALAVPWIGANTPLDPEILARSGAEWTRQPSFAGLVFLAAAAGLWKLRREPAAAFTGCLFLAIVLSVESQVLTGFAIRLMRFVYLGVAFLLVAAAGLLARRLSESRQWLWLTVALFMVAGGRTVSYASQRYQFQGLPRDLETAFDYLNAQTPGDSVVVALGPQETLLIPVYTHNKTMIGTGYNATCDIPFSEQFSRISLAARLYGIPLSALREKLEKPQWREPSWEQRWNRELWGGKVDWLAREWRGFFDYYGGDMPAARFLELLKAQEAKGPDFAAEADYLWVGPLERELLSPKALKKLGYPMFENPSVRIYRIGT